MNEHNHLTIGMDGDITPRQLMHRGAGLTHEQARAALARSGDSGETLLSALDDALGTIARDQGLTDRGRIERERAVLNRTRAEWTERSASLDAELKTILDDAERVTSRDFRHRLVGGQSAEEMVRREAQVLDLTRDYDNEQIEALYLDACRDGDLVVVRALESLPPTLQRITEQVLSLGAEMHAQVVAPESLQALQDARTAADLARSNAQRVESRLGLADDHASVMDLIEAQAS